MDREAHFLSNEVLHPGMTINVAKYFALREGDRLVTIGDRRLDRV